MSSSKSRLNFLRPFQSGRSILRKTASESTPPAPPAPAPPPAPLATYDHPSFPRPPYSVPPRPSITPIHTPIPMEIIEIIIDHAPDGPTFLACALVCKTWLARCRYYLFSRISVPAGSCDSVLEILQAPKVANGAGGTARMTLPPAGNFVQSLVITPTASHYLEVHERPTISARELVDVVPNVRELHLKGVNHWSVEHFLVPIAKRGQLEDLTLAWITIPNLEYLFERVLSVVGQGLKCLRIEGVRFSVDCVWKKHPDNSESLDGLIRLALDSNSFFTDKFVQSVLESSPNALSQLQAVELPVRMFQRGSALMERIADSLTEVSIDGSGGIDGKLDISCFKRLKRIRISAINTQEAIPSVSQALRRYQYDAIVSLTLGTTYNWGMLRSGDAWEMLDETLGLPHLARINCVNVEVGLLWAGLFANTLLPNACHRGIVNFLP